MRAASTTTRAGDAAQLQEEHYEVPPCSQRVVWLEGQHLKPMLAFEALSKALGWSYNYHKPQVNTIIEFITSDTFGGVTELIPTKLNLPNYIWQHQV